MVQQPVNRSNTPKGKKKTRKFRFRFSIIILIFALSFGVNFWIFWKGAHDGDISAEPVINEVTTSGDVTSTTDSAAEGTTVSDLSSAADPQNITNPIPESARINSSYFDTCAFIGDSTMMGIGSYGFVDTKNVYTARGLRPDQLLNTKITTEQYGDAIVLDAMKQATPKNVYMLLGSNGVSWLDNNKIISDYKAFIAELKTALPDVNIYIISVFPVGTAVEAKPSASEGQVLNTQVDSFNQMLLQMANDEKIYYIDLNSTLKDANGKLSSDITTDGTHINKSAYEDVVNFILSHTVGQ